MYTDIHTKCFKYKRHSQTSAGASFIVYFTNLNPKIAYLLMLNRVYIKEEQILFAVKPSTFTDLATSDEFPVPNFFNDPRFFYGISLSVKWVLGKNYRP